MPIALLIDFLVIDKSNFISKIIITKNEQKLELINMEYS